MAINLAEIRQAVKTYIDSKLVVTTVITPGTGDNLNPSEDFTFKMTVQNNGDVQVKNLRYRVQIANASIGKIKVPSSSDGATTNLDTSTIVTSGEVRYLEFSPSSSDLKVLEPGESDSYTFKGKAGSSAGGGSCNIVARAYADPDLDYLFPKQEGGTAVTKVLKVVG